MFPTRPHVERAGPQILRLVSPRSALFLLPFFGADFQKFSGFATGADVVRKDKKPSSVGLFSVLKLAAGRGISDAIFLKISCPEDARARFTQGGYTAHGGDSQNTNFPISFSSPLSAFATTRRTGSTGGGYNYAIFKSPTNMTTTYDQQGGYWLAFGT